MATQLQGRIPPQNIDGERALLGSIMIKPDSMHEVVETITPEAFYAEKHRHIFKSMFELHTRNEPIDLLSVSTSLKNSGKLDQAGGSSYLSELVNTVPTASNAGYYAELVHRAYLLRRLIQAAEHVGELGYKQDEDLDEILDKAEKQIYDVTNSPNIHKFTALSQSLSEAWERLDFLHKSKEEIRGVHTGYKELDNLLAGFQPSDLIILAARPSMGKSTLALDMTRKTATQYNTKVGYFSLEMSNEQLVDRMLASEAKVDAWKLRTGKITTDSEFNQIRDALDRLSSAPIFLDDFPGTNMLKLRSVARRLKREHGLDLLIVDYLQLMTPSVTKASDSMVQQITEISRGLKILAKELNIPVIALSQLSRAIEQRRGKPRLSDLRDSGSIEQDADVVIFIHRDDKMNENSDRPNIAEILVEKHRNGPTGKIELYFDEKRASYMSIEKSNFANFQEAAAPSGEQKDEDFF